MSDRTQIGPTVDSELWQRLRESVESRKGTVRGNLGDELDTAIRKHLGDEVDPDMQAVNQRLRRIESELGIAAADGGVDISSGETHTRAPTEKPASNAPTNQKVEWLAAELISEVFGDRTKDAPREVSRDVIRDVVKDRYGFRRDTAKRYVGELIDYFGYVDHPNADGLVCTPDRRDELRAAAREDAAEQANGQLDELANAGGGNDE